MQYQIDSLYSDFKHTLKDQLIIIYWLKDYFVNFAEYSYLKKVKSSKNNKKAIIIGNGPSLDLIPINAIIEFQKNEGEVFTVNYFNRKQSMRNIKPDFYFSADPNTHLSDNFCDVIDQIKNSEKCKIFVPTYSIKIYKNIFKQQRVHGFCAIQKRRNFFRENTKIRPDRPNSFSSMTAYYALALAIWLDYKEIYIIGIDNTYLSNVICNNKNEIFEVLNHAGVESSLINRSSEFDSIFDYLFESARLFYDLNKFKSEKIINLDPNSLVDSFKKSNTINESIYFLSRKF